LAYLFFSVRLKHCIG